MSDLHQRFPYYHRVLRLYPRDYQRHYTEPMLQTLADMLDDASTPRQRLFIWARIAVDTPFSLLLQNIHYLGDVMTHQTPSYVKQNSLIGGFLLAPFMTFLIINGLTTHGLYHTWLWRFPVLFTWLIILPALAAIIGLGTLLIWLRQSGARNLRSSLRLLLDFKRSWSLLGIVAAGIGIILLVRFHDSVHCIKLNPIDDWHNAHDTWRCIQNN